jgi:hypothetical protein
MRGFDMSLPIYGYEVFNVQQAQAILALAIAKGQPNRAAVARQVIQQFQQGA